jgi:hypothetical protein
MPDISSLSPQAAIRHINLLARIFKIFFQSSLGDRATLKERFHGSFRLELDTGSAIAPRTAL